MAKKAVKKTVPSFTFIRQPSYPSDRARIPLQVVAIAGATTTLVAAGTLQAVESTPSYEGSVQLAGVLPVSQLQDAERQDIERQDAEMQDAGIPDPNPSARSVTLSPALANANIAPPDLIKAIQPGILQQPDMISVVTAKLRQQGVQINKHTLLRQLTAKTSPQGWLELHYQDTDPNRVQLVLEQVAQWYVVQVPDCDIQACQDAVYIESQIPIWQQRRQVLNQEMADFQDMLRQKGVNGLSGRSIEEQNRRLLVEQHEQLRHISQLDHQIDAILLQIKDYQTQMNLGDVKVHAGLALLRRAIPQYQRWLTEWQQGDRQLITTVLKQKTEQVSPTPDRTEGRITQLSQQQQALYTDMQKVVMGIAKQRLVDMPAPVQELILDDLVRLEFLGGWLEHLHQFQLLQKRRQNLVELQTQTLAQAKEWNQLMALQSQLQRDLEQATETLVAYQTRYTVVRQKTDKQELAWRVVAPPEIVQEPTGLAWLLSRTGQDANASLMTVAPTVRSASR